MTRIVASLGTDHHPFTRLAEWMATVAEELGADVLVQTGATLSPPGLTAVDFVPADELATLMRGADAVVCHGGPGTIALARSVGHRPIVVPRDPARGEHVDDHQVRFTAQLADEDVVDVARSVTELVRLLATPRERVGEADALADVARAVNEFGELMDRLMSSRLARRRARHRLLLRRRPRRA